MKTLLQARRLAAGLALLEVGAVVAPVVVLGRWFDFPAILRQPADRALTLLSQNQAHVVPAYYLFLLSGLLLVPLSVALGAALRPAGAGRGLAAGLLSAGLGTAVFQALGFSRWVFVVPYLAARYQAGPPAERPTVALLYEVLNRYLGLTVGEHLGFLGLAAWTLTLAFGLRRVGGPRGLAAVGALAGLGLGLSVLEHFGGPRAAGFAQLNLAANSLWSGWLLAVAGWLRWGRPAPSETTEIS